MFRQEFVLTSTESRVILWQNELRYLHDLRRASPELTVGSTSEVNVSDRLGGRTYFWNRRPELLATLDDADLSCPKGASMLHVDWYYAPHIERAMRYARQLDVPVFLNIEHAHQDTEGLKSLVPYASICQAVNDASQLGEDAERVASEQRHL